MTLALSEPCKNSVEMKACGLSLSPLSMLSLPMHTISDKEQDTWKQITEQVKRRRPLFGMSASGGPWKRSTLSVLKCQRQQSRPGLGSCCCLTHQLYITGLSELLSLIPMVEPPISFLLEPCSRYSAINTGHSLSKH